jgi:hypothetical protein
MLKVYGTGETLEAEIHRRELVEISLFVAKELMLTA